MAADDEPARTQSGKVGGTPPPEPGTRSPEERDPGEPRPEARRRDVARLVRRALGVLGLVALIALVVYAYLPKPVPVDFARVERGELVVSVEEDGRTRVKDRFVVSAPLTGTLARLALEPGDTVDEQQVLARLVPLASPLLDARARAESRARVAQTQAAQRQARAAIARAEAALELAESEAERQASLARGGAASAAALERARLEARSAREDLASARFGARVADHEVQMARAALGQFDRGPEADGEQLLVRSPVAGTVLQVFQESEGVVQAGTPILEVGDPGALEIVVDVLTTDAVQVELGAPVEIDRWGGGVPLLGRVRRKDPSAFTRVSALGVEEQRVNVVVDLTDPRDRWRALGDGYRVETRIRLWEGDDVLRVPASAVFRADGGWAVYAVRDGAARLTEVNIGQRNGRQTQIVGGLSEGEQVVLHPSDRVEDGVAVEAR